MAQSASKDAVQAAMKPPEYRSALKRLASIGPLKKKQSQGAKKIDDIYNAAETVNGVHKAASQFFLKIQGSDDAEKLRIFRDINGLLEADGTPTSGADMVDMAQGKEVNLRLAHDADKPEGMEESDVGDEADALEGDARDDEGDHREAASDADEVDGDDNSTDGQSPGPDDGADTFEEADEDELAAQATRQDIQASRDEGGNDHANEAAASEADRSADGPEGGESSSGEDGSGSEASAGNDADAGDDRPLHERMKAATDQAAADNSDLMGDE